MSVALVLLQTSLLQSALNISAKGHDLFLSSEAFSEPAMKIAELKDFLTPRWPDVTIVAYYRSLMDWLLSLYFQRNRYHFHGASLQNPTPRPDLVDFMSNRTAVDEEIRDSYTLGVVQRFGKHFNNVVVKDMHQTKNLVSDFFCSVLGATKACTKSKAMQKGAVRANQQYAFALEDMIFGTHRRKLIEIEKVGDRFRTKRGTYFSDLQQKTLKYYFESSKTNPFPINCLSEDDRAYLHQRSIEAVRDLFAGESSWREAAMNLEFERYAIIANTSTSISAFSREMLKICSVDIEAALDKPEWQNFFQKL